MICCMTPNLGEKSIFLAPVMHAAVVYKNGGVAKKRAAAAAFGGVASYHTDTQATAIVTKLTMNSPSKFSRTNM